MFGASSPSRWHIQRYPCVDVMPMYAIQLLTAATFINTPWQTPAAYMQRKAHTNAVTICHPADLSPLQYPIIHNMYTNGRSIFVYFHSFSRYMCFTDFFLSFFDSLKHVHRVQPLEKKRKDSIENRTKGYH